MKIAETSVFVGSSIYAPLSAVRYRIDFGSLTESETAHPSAVPIDSLFGILPGLKRRIGVAESDPASTFFAHVFVHTALELQTLAGFDVDFSKVSRTEKPHVMDIAFEHEDAEVGQAAGKLAAEFVNTLLRGDSRKQGTPPGMADLAQARDRFIRNARRRGLNYYVAPMVRAAEARGIPWSRVGRRTDIIRLGQGKFQKRLRETVTSDTSAMGLIISKDKRLTSRALVEAGLPAARQQTVATVAQAVRIAEDFGYPVVVKPADLGRGAGVSLRLNTAAEVRAAFAKASRYRHTVILESYIPGSDHRMLVVDGELVSTVSRVAAHVTGDGKRSINQLVEELNSDPRRGSGEWYALGLFKFDKEANSLLAKAGHTRESVPADGEVVYLRSVPNMLNGGYAIDLTQHVHDDNRIMAVRAAQVVGLNVAGIDFVTPDISQSYKKAGGGIAEVNSYPSLRPHLAIEGTPRDVVGPIIDMLYPPDASFRIPIAAVTGNTDPTPIIDILIHILETAGHSVGMATQREVRTGNFLAKTGDGRGLDGARTVLSDPTVDAAVFEISPQETLHGGLGFSDCNVAAVLGNAGESKSLSEQDAFAAAKVVVDAARDMVVFNADDPFSLRHGADVRADRICYATMRQGFRPPDNAAGKASKVIWFDKDDDVLRLHDEDEAVPLIPLGSIPRAGKETKEDAIWNAMIAATLAYGMGKTIEQIRMGLHSL